MKAILTSSLGGQIKTEGKRLPARLPETNIFPHFEALRDEMLDGLRLIEDITYSDSMRHEIIALNNGSYIVADNGTETLYGEAYSIRNGVQRQICTDDKWIRL